MGFPVAVHLAVDVPVVHLQSGPQVDAMTGAGWIRSAEYCGSSAFAVLRSFSTSLSWRRGRFPWSRLLCRSDSPQLLLDKGVDVPFMQVAKIPVVAQRVFYDLADHRISPVAG